MEEWFYYNTAAGSFHPKKLCIYRLYSTELEFYSQKRQIRFLSHPLGKLGGNVRTSSIARWKARCRLPIRENWIFFASSYGWDVISRYWSKPAFFKGGRVSLSANFRWNGTSPTNLCWCQKTRVITHSRGINISTLSYFISSQSTRVTDGWTDRQNYDPQESGSIAASRGNNWSLWSDSLIN